MDRDREREIRRRKIQQAKLAKKRRNLVISIIFLIVALIVSLTWLMEDVNYTSFLEQDSIYKMKETPYKISLGRENKNTFVSVNDNYFYHITKDTVVMYDHETNKIWENMHDFINVKCYEKKGNLIAYDEGTSKKIDVYNEKGLLYSITPTLNVKKAKVNADGYSVVVYDENGMYHLYVYDNLGRVILSRTDDNMALLDFDISNDNKYLMLSYLDLMDMNIKSNVVFQYLDETDSIKYNAIDGTFSWLAKDNEIVGRTTFIGNYAYTISDKQIQKFSVDKNSVVEEMNINFTNIINDIVVVDDKYFVVSMGNEDINEKGYPVNSIVIFDDKGDAISTTQLEKSPTFIKKGSSGYIVNVDNEITNYNLKGNELWSFNNGMVFSDFLSLNSNDKALAIDSTTAVVVEMQKELASEIEKTEVEEVKVEVEEEK